MAPIAGWYDDPRDSNKLRYWDGAAWTEHVTEKEQQSPGQAMPVFPGAVEAQQHIWQYGQPPVPQQEQQPPPEQQQPWPPSAQGGWPPQQQQQQPQQGWQPQQQQQGWPPQQQQQPGWPPQQQPWPPAPMIPPGAVLTPDGAQVTTWIKRFAARLLDGIFVAVGTLPLTGYFLYRAGQQLMDQMDDGSYNAFSPSSQVVAWETAAIAIIVVSQLIYETFSLRRWGATPGKRVLGISVRLWDRGGLLPWPTIARRLGFVYGLAALSLLPVVGILASIVALVDYLFPLWDKRRQALHDKFSNTAVIEGPRIDAPAVDDPRLAGARSDHPW